MRAEDRAITTLQDICHLSNLDATELVGSIMGKLIMQSNNVALLKAAIARPSLMDANLAIALGDDELAFQAQRMHFQMAGFLKGEGTQINHLVQNIQGTGIVSFEDDSHQSTASVKAEGRSAPVPTVEPTSSEADASIIDADA